VTISVLVCLKYPRQATYVEQRHIASGPQQVSNGAAFEAFPQRYAQVRMRKNPQLSKINY